MTTKLDGNAAIYIQRTSEMARIPVFTVDPARVELVNPQKLSDAPIVVRRADGKDISSSFSLNAVAPIVTSKTAPTQITSRPGRQ